MPNSSNLQVEGLQALKTLSGSTPVSQEQISEASVGKGSQRLDSWRLEKRSPVWWGSISAEADGRIRIWLQQQEFMNLIWLVSTIRAAAVGVMVWGMYSWYTLGNMIPINHRLITTAYMTVPADHLFPFMVTIYHDTVKFPLDPTQINQYFLLTAVCTSM